MNDRLSNNFYLAEGELEKRKIAGIVFMTPFNLEQFLTINTYTYQFYKFWIRPAIGLTPTIKEKPIGTKALADLEEYPAFVEHFDNVENDYKRLNKSIQSDGGKLVIILLPAENEVRDDNIDGVFFKTIRGIAKKYDIPVIDTMPSLRKARQEGIKVYGNVFDGDLHTHANGLEIVAEQAIDWMRKNY